MRCALFSDVWDIMGWLVANESNPRMVFLFGVIFELKRRNK